MDPGIIRGLAVARAARRGTPPRVRNVDVVSTVNIFLVLSPLIATQTICRISIFHSLPVKLIKRLFILVTAHQIGAPSSRASPPLRLTWRVVAREAMQLAARCVGPIPSINYHGLTAHAAHARKFWQANPAC